jgi:cysteine synthase
MPSSTRKSALQGVLVIIMADFFGYDIGDTRLFEVPELVPRYGSKVMVKDESENSASNTFKDRRNMWVLMQDIDYEGPICYVQITSGNSGYSMGLLTEKVRKETGKGRQIINIVPRSLNKKTSKLLGKYGPVVPIDLCDGILHWHQLMEIAKKYTDRGTKIKTVERLGNGRDGYCEILSEIMSETDPTHVFASVGSGECLYALGTSLKGSDLKLVGATIDDNCIASGGVFLEQIEKSPADMLGCRYTSFGDLIRRQQEELGYDIVVVSDENISDEQKFLNCNLMLDVDANAAAAFAAAKKYGDDGKLKSDDNAIIIKTARNRNRIQGLGKPSPLRRYGPAAAAAACIMLGTLTGNEYRSWQNNQEAKERQKQEERNKEYLEEMRKAFVKDISESERHHKYLAFATIKGNGVIDHNVYQRLIWFDQDSWARQSGTIITDTVDEFYKWLHSLDKEKKEKTIQRESADSQE